ncbi:unnamed protein product [Amoebophrya sp. A120]|nr:unnamed protein product [Amoebophrya sp. A120]|eukprot:GSA120T00018362001.1
MCICLILYRPNHAHFPFICCHNRDEDASREFSDMALLQDDDVDSLPLVENGTSTTLQPQKILCSRDHQAQGTATGLDIRSGNWAVLTNCRTKVAENSRSHHPPGGPPEKEHAGGHQSDIVADSPDHESSERSTEKKSRGQLVKRLIFENPSLHIGEEIAGHYPPCHVCWGNIYSYGPGGDTTKMEAASNTRRTLKSVSNHCHVLQNKVDDDEKSAGVFRGCNPTLCYCLSSAAAALPEEKFLVFSNGPEPVLEQDSSSTGQVKCRVMRKRLLERNVTDCTDQEELLSILTEEFSNSDFLELDFAFGGCTSRDDEGEIDKTENMIDVEQEQIKKKFSYSPLPAKIEENLCRRICFDEPEEEILKHFKHEFQTVSQTFYISNAVEEAVFCYFRRRRKSEDLTTSGSSNEWGKWKVFKVPWAGSREECVELKTTTASV